MYLCQNRPKGKQWNEKENGLKPFSSNGKHHLNLMVRPFGVSVRFCLFHYPDVLGFGIFPSRLIVYIHPTLAHTFDLDYPAIYFHVIGIDRGYRHSGGRGSCPPF